MKTIQRSIYFQVDPNKIRENLSKIIEILELKTDFEGFLHYTDIKNIDSILKSNQLYSREKAKDVISIDAANQDVLQHTSSEIKRYVRFFYKELTPTIFINEGIKLNHSSVHMPIPILLIFDKKIIYHENVAFLSGGGGNHLSKFTNDSFRALKFDWDSILFRGPVPRIDEFSSKEEIAISREITNFKNAEFLYKDSISTEYIKNIYFRSQADLKHFNTINEGRLLCNLIVNPKKFFCKNENDYLDDYDIKNINGKTYLGLRFHRFHKEFSHKLCINTKDNTVQNEYWIDEELLTNEVVKLPIPLDLLNYHYYLELNLDNIEKIQFYINGYLSLIWRGHE